MAKYYVNNNAQPNGDHEVHREDCTFLPADRTYLGDFSSCFPAVEKAKTIYRSADGCYHCCRECHKH
jgi:hypothetical protein